MPKKTGANPGKMEEGYVADEEASGTKKKAAKPPLETEKLLQQFKTDFTAHLKESAKNRVSYQTSRINRRLDSLARLLEGNNICTAVSFDVKNKKILIAANKIFSGSQTTNNYISLIEKVMALLVDHQSSIILILEKLSNIIGINLAQEERFSVEKLKKELDISQPQFNNAINLLLMDLFKSGLTTKEWRDNIDETTFDDDVLNSLKEQKSFSKIVAKISRIARDFMKLRRTLYSEHTSLPPTQKELLAAIKNSKQHKIVRAGKKDLHVEMRIIEERKTQNTLDGSYIGISKLCCDHCGLAVEVVNPKENAQMVRGKHGQGPKKWFLPTFLKQDATTLKAYMGNAAHQAYQQLPDLQQKEALNFIESKESSPYKMGKRSMQPDSSDSDEEFGFTCSEDEIEECLNNINYQDIWTLRAIKTDYKKQLYRLLSLGIPINDILNIYKESSDKFVAMSGKKVCALLQAQMDDEPNELFEKLSEAYDKSKTMFEDIIDDSENLIEEYGFDEVLEQYQYFRRTAKKFDDEGNQTDFYTLTTNKLNKEHKSGYEYRSDDSQNIRTESDPETNSNYSNPSDSEQERTFETDEDETNDYSP